MKKLIHIALLAIFTCCLQTQAQPILKMTDKSVNVEQWILTHFGKGKVPPFSFAYSGVESSHFIKSWKHRAQKLTAEQPYQIKYLFTYTDPKTGLSVECTVNGFTDYNTVDWVLRFENRGSSPTPQITHVLTGNLLLNYPRKGSFYLHHANGSTASRADFAPHSVEMNPGDTIHFRPSGGRSSDTVFPFYNLESPASQGVVAAIGWSGTWMSDFRCLSGNQFQFQTGIEHFNAYLNPGEKVRFPSLCLLFWQGKDRMTGHNLFRRYLLTHHSRHIDGKPVFYPISGGFNWGDPAPCEEFTCLDTDYALALINRYNRFGIRPEVYWLDAGWYEQSADYANGKGWYNTAGNWFVDSLRFEQGFRPISERAHKTGSKFMVWFEPERVAKGTLFHRLHPEWMIQAGDQFLFDLSQPEAVKWLSKYIGDFIEQNGIDYYRQDFNIAPEEPWRNHDAPNRQGITEVKYIEGLYTYWDYLLTRFPTLLIDNCASGGRRLDYETALRSAPLWRTDYSYSERVGYQCHTYGLEFFLPQHGTGVYSTNPFDFRSSFSDAVVMNWKLAQPGQSFTDMQKCMKEFSHVRPYFHEDFYPLSGTGDLTKDDIWLAYQLFRPSDQTGYIVAFRREQNKEKDYVVKLSGLQSDRKYTLTNQDSQKKIEKTGQELTEGLTLSLENPRSSLLIKIE